ncbi:4a-hydroxytetrahydrobiopterin dehydratase [Marchantia polymorpha subsp. ruderalis]|uniref:4a-hydroxytetrahydrobiopterin dehydratase n=1 Tax=Marchantia polymorpha TaxID=3197 RepID=A0A2R6WPH6_MARPO|nr:hypothetical protein MARPO_0069s0079 [Marchantia polymorpha]BBN03538.1 hypothetical protein Mp_2g24300 [Marchantia polymorpha subsp. ruderalis]|eukprot:PTQ35744.1 hypothetical protein MARPO_0069s0079 [Marchantia polymorpha]
MAASACVCRLAPAPAAFVSSALDSSSLSTHRASFSRCKIALRNGSSFTQIGEPQRGNFVFRINAGEIGDFGARDPFPQEIESNFGDKVLGHAGTEHIILIPSSLLGLSEKSCQPLEPGTQPLSEVEAKALLRKVIGWRLISNEKGLKIFCEWNVKDFGSGVTLIDRIAVVASSEEHYPELHLERGNKVRAEISTQSIGGLSENDFILAAKIDKIQTSDLVKKTRFWA